MTMDEDFSQFDERRHARYRVKDLEKLLDMYLNRIRNENRAFGYRLELVAEEKEKPFDSNEQVLKLSSEFKNLKIKLTNT